MATWKIVIEAWPFSTGQGAAKDQAEVSPRVREWLIEADDYGSASLAAEHIQMGVASHDKVWQAKIRAVAQWPIPQASRS